MRWQHSKKKKIRKPQRSGRRKKVLSQISVGKTDETVKNKSKPFQVIRSFLCGLPRKGLDFIFVWITLIMYLV